MTCREKKTYVGLFDVMECTPLDLSNGGSFVSKNSELARIRVTQVDSAYYE